MPFVEQRGGVNVLVFLHQLIGGRGRIIKRHVALAFAKEAVGFAGALGDGYGFLRQFFPGGGGVIAKHLLHPQHEALSRRADARVGINHRPRLLAFHQLMQAARRVFQAGLVVDEAEPAVVIRHKHRIRPAVRQFQLAGIHAARREQAGIERGLHQGVVNADDDIGAVLLALLAQAVQNHHAVIKGDIFHLAVADFFKGGFQTGTRAPLGVERAVGIDGEHRLGTGGRGGERKKNQEFFEHFAPRFQERRPAAKVENASIPPPA